MKAIGLHQLQTLMHGCLRGFCNVYRLLLPSEFGSEDIDPDRTI